MFIFGSASFRKVFLNQLPVATERLELAVPRGHSLTKINKPRLRDLVDAPFIWFPRREGPAFYDRVMHECYRGGLKSPRVVQEAGNEATVLSLVSHGLGVAWINETARWRCRGRSSHFNCQRSELAIAGGSSLEERQHRSPAHEFHWRGPPTDSSGAEEEVTQCDFFRLSSHRFGG